LNDTFFFSAPQLKRDPLGDAPNMASLVMPHTVVRGPLTIMLDEHPSGPPLLAEGRFEDFQRYLRALDSAIDRSYASYAGPPGERTLVVSVNTDLRARGWLLARVGEPMQDEEASVLESMSEITPVALPGPMAFSLHFAVGGAPMSEHGQASLPSEWTEIMNRPGNAGISLRHLLDVLWSENT